MEKIPYYAITVRRYNILFRHTEWFHQTQALYNEVLLFYYQLYLETFTDEQPGTQEALRILEKLTIVGRDKQPVPNPLPWKKVPLYFRRAAINTATAAAKSYLARDKQEQPTGAFTESVTFYKGMYRDFQGNTISLKLWDGERMAVVQTASPRKYSSGRRTDDVTGTGSEERPRGTSYPMENTSGRRAWCP